jgi:hypothetical protein
MNLKTNLLHDATLSINLGTEFGLSNKMSLDLPITYTAWMSHYKFVLVQPEARYWFGNAFRGSFIGLHAHYVHYNIAAIGTRPMRAYRYQGNGYGGGISYGYRWNLSRRLGMEASLGFGYTYFDSDKSDCITCGDYHGKDRQGFFTPTRAALSFIYRFGAEPQAKPQAPVVHPTPVVLRDTIVRVDTVFVKPDTVVVMKPDTVVVEKSVLTVRTDTLQQHARRGTAYITYPVSGATILPTFGNNRDELAKIATAIDEVKNLSDAEIRQITIRAYASPEGNYQTNLQLSQRRAEALRRYLIDTYGIESSLIRAVGAGENWDGLDEAVQRSDAFSATEKTSITRLIREVGIFDGREASLMKLDGGRIYQRLRTEIFPTLRRSDYEIDYVFTTTR